MEERIVRKHMVASGRVQGCGFRFFVNMTADKYHLTGWVMNCDDGTVELEAQGTPEAIDRFTEEIKSGNRFARVDSLWVSNRKVEEEKRFRTLN